MDLGRLLSNRLVIEYQPVSVLLLYAAWGAMDIASLAPTKTLAMIRDGSCDVSSCTCSDRTYLRGDTESNRQLASSLCMVLLAVWLPIHALFGGAYTDQDTCEGLQQLTFTVAAI